MRIDNKRRAVGTAIALVTMTLIGIIAVVGAYYLGTSAKPQNQTNPNAETITSTILRTITLTQGQTFANSDSAVLNMTYSSSCVSVGNSSWPSCSNSDYSIVFKNTGNTLVSSGTVQIYFGNGTTIYGKTSCAFNSTILPQYTYTCSGSTPNNVPAYSKVMLSILYPNGKTYSYTYTPASPSLTLYGVTLYSGVTGDNNTVPATSRFTITLEHTGTPIRISSITLTGSGLSGAITSWSITPTEAGSNSFFTDGNNQFNKDEVITITLYPLTATSVAINNGQTYNYVIDTGTGSITGGIIAQ